MSYFHVDLSTVASLLLPKKSPSLFLYCCSQCPSSELVVVYPKTILPLPNVAEGVPKRGTCRTSVLDILYHTVKASS